MRTPVVLLRRIADLAVLLVTSVGRVLGLGLRTPLGRPVRQAWAGLMRAFGMRSDVITAPSDVGMRRLAVAGLVANGFIVVSGGIVRVSESGLGCPTWPRCTPGSLLPEPHEDVPLLNMLIEFGNRMVTFAILLVSVLVLIAAASLRSQRPDLVRLAVAQPVGVLAQGVLGGLTVLSGLHPALVGAHYLLSAVVIIACVALVVRTREGDRPPEPVVAPRPYLLARVLPYLAFALLAAGTVVTGAGPHAGDAETERYAFAGAGTVEAVARVHSLLVWITLAVTVALMILVRRQRPDGPPGIERVTRHLNVLGMIILGQGALGYLQYATGVPAGLVVIHITGSVAFWVSALFVRFSVRSRGGPESTPYARTGATVQSGTQ